MRPGSGTPVFNGVLDPVEKHNPSIESFPLGDASCFGEAEDAACDNPVTASLVRQDHAEPRWLSQSFVDLNAHSILFGFM